MKRKTRCGAGTDATLRTQRYACSRQRELSMRGSREAGERFERQMVMTERRAEPDGVHRRGRDRSGRVLLKAAVIAVAGTVAGAGCSQARQDTPRAAVVVDLAETTLGVPVQPTGQVRVRLEDAGGPFQEGFEVGLRFETGDGRPIAATLWSDFIASTGRTDIDSYYHSVLNQSVPAGTVQVEAEANVGEAGGPSIPDLTGKLPCSLTVEVDPGSVVLIEVTFRTCLHVVDADGTTLRTF